MAERSDKSCMKCGTTLTKYFPKEIENFILIKHAEFNRNEPAHRCHQCGMIYQFDWSEMEVDGKMEKLLMVFSFKIEQEGETDSQKN